MDELWVPSHNTKGIARISGVTKPIYVAPHSLDMSSYNRATTGNQIQELQSGFNFVFVGEFIERKNIKALLMAFHNEFETWEPTSDVSYIFTKNNSQNAKNSESVVNIFYTLNETLETIFLFIGPEIFLRWSKCFQAMI